MSSSVCSGLVAILENLSRIYPKDIHLAVVVVVIITIPTGSLFLCIQQLTLRFGPFQVGLSGCVYVHYSSCVATWSRESRSQQHDAQHQVTLCLIDSIVKGQLPFIADFLILITGERLFTVLIQNLLDNTAGRTCIVRLPVRVHQ